MVAGEPIELPIKMNNEGPPRLFPADLVGRKWDEHWVNMPTFEMGDTEAAQKIIVHFRTREDVQRFAELLGAENIWAHGQGSRISERTDSMWFGGPDSDYVAPLDLLWKSRSPLLPRYPVYVPSVGRWDRPLTARALDSIGVPHHVVVEPAQYDNYARSLGEERLLVLPEDYSTRSTGSIPARNWIWEHSLAAGHARHWVIDDNVRGFVRMHRNRRIAVGDAAIFCASEDFTDRYENIAFSGFNYQYLTKERDYNFPPYYLNTRVYSIILVNNALPHRWRGRYNEDTDLCLRALKDGWCTVLFNAFLADKVSTLLMKGGNTDTIYATGDKRLEFARSLAEQHPDVVRVVWRYNRWHHEVDYRGYARNRLKLRDDFPRPMDPEYGMQLIKTPGRKRRYHGFDNFAK